MKTEAETAEEYQASDELLAWYQKHTARVSHPVLVGMLVSAAAQLLTGVREANRETFTAIAGRAWDRWVVRRGPGVAVKAPPS